MCGILGKVIFDGSKIDINKIDKALNLMTHRGPDDYGILNDEKFCFAFRRLSIIDLSNLGNQPMQSFDKKVSIIFNGEIYNFKELRNILLKKGYKFKSSSDTEVLLYLYYEFGINCLDKINGMFAFAIFDKRSDEFFLVRDRVGIKPLFYNLDKDGFIFSSEIKSILSFNDNKKYDLNDFSISSYLSFRYPLNNNTFFKNIKSLEPAHYLRIKNKKIQINKYWDYTDSFKLQEDDRGEEFYINKTKYLLESSVKYRMISDVPVGCFLSGGVDSSIVSYLMSKNSINQINTFTIGFEEENFNEFEYSRKIAQMYKTNHREIVLTGFDYVDEMNDLISFKDSPLSVPNEVPLYLMSKELKKYITVVLSGEGADEIFGGYGRIFRSPYDFARIKNKEEYFSSTEKKLFSEKFFNKYGVENFDNEVDHFYNIYSYTSIDEKYRLINENFLKNHDNTIKKTFNKIFNEINDNNYYNKIMYLFSKLHIQGLLNRVDNSTMSTSVEARVPFLDHRLIEFAFSIPLKYKLKWKSKKHESISKHLTSNEISENYDIPKYILKKSYEKKLTKEIAYRQKMGFPVPLNNWFSENFNELAKKILIDDYTKSLGIFNLKNIEKLLNSKFESNTGMNIWKLINIVLFTKKYFYK